MTKKDFKLIATVLYHYKQAFPYTIEKLTEAFAQKLVEGNLKFDPIRFKEAALNGKGIESPKGRSVYGASGLQTPG